MPILRTALHFLVITALSVSVALAQTDYGRYLAAINTNDATLLGKLIKNGFDVNSSNAHGYTPLMACIGKNRISLASQLLENGANINALARNGHSALHLAVRLDRLDFAHFLIGNGADIDIRDAAGRSPLFDAVRRGKHAFMDLLIEAGANLDLKDKRGKTPLFEAMSHGWQGIANALIVNGASIHAEYVGDTALVSASRRGLKETVSFLIAYGADVNRIAEGKYATTPLNAASMRNYDATITEILISAGADVNKKDGLGTTPLHNAAGHGRLSILRSLIKAEANPNLQDRNGVAPIYYALLGGDPAVVSDLIKAGARFGPRSIKGKALFKSAISGQELELSRILKNGVAINEPDQYGTTALMYAAFQGNYRNVNTLLTAGVDQNAKDKQGHSALVYAVLGARQFDRSRSLSDRTKVIDLLIDKGVDPNSYDKTGVTVLFMALDRNNKAIFKSLLDGGADVNRVYRDGNRSLLSASIIQTRREGDDITTMIIDSGAKLDAQSEYSGSTPLHNAVLIQNLIIVKKLVYKGAKLSIQDKKGLTPLGLTRRPGYKDSRKGLEIFKLLRSAGAR